MAQYWIANFDFEECFEHGLQNKFWLMQYQYADEHGNRFQGDRAGAVTRNWRRLKRIQPGDFLVAYLSKKRNPQLNGFFAIGEVIAPRQSAEHMGTVEEYVKNKRSHEFSRGVVHYSDAPAMYEDFNDSWRAGGNPTRRFAQRIDVKQWTLVRHQGVPWLKELDYGPADMQSAIFQITPEDFEAIKTKLREQALNAADEAALSKVVESNATLAAEAEQAKAQGYMVDAALRRKIELHAMKKATEYFELHGYSVVDVSAKKPYDLECSLNGDTLFVEVKGTQSTGEAIFLTANEVTQAQQHPNQSALFILHSIEVSNDRGISGGEQVVQMPWYVKAEDLQPLTYRYQVKQVD